MPNTDKYLTASQKRLDYADGIFFGTLKGNTCFINNSREAQFKVERSFGNTPKDVEVLILNHIGHVFEPYDHEAENTEGGGDSGKMVLWMAISFIVIAGYHIFFGK